jgi:hypothetical protein
MYPTSIIVATLIADRERQAHTAREVRAARRRSTSPGPSRPVRAAVTRIARVAAANRGGANDHVGL